MYVYRVQHESVSMHIQSSDIKKYEKPPYTIWEEDSENPDYCELVYSPDKGVVKEIVIPAPFVPDTTPTVIKRR